MVWLAAGTLVLVLFGGWAFPRARRELESRGRLALPTVAAAFVAYAGHAVIALVAAWKGVWHLAIERDFAIVTGLVVAAAGAALYLAGRIEFGSFRRTWGLEGDRLITTGVYRYSRNPQMLGSILVISAAAVAGRSAATLVLAGVLTVAQGIWLPVEERILERRFGEAYTRYRRRTARFLGLPRDA
jgi:protein-S-isoprenylcysteine O-methyltransferase Ste14